MEQNGTGKACEGRCEDKVTITRRAADSISWPGVCLSFSFLLLPSLFLTLSDGKYLTLFQLNNCSLWRVKSCAENEIENILCFCYCGGYFWEQVWLWADRTGFEATVYILYSTLGFSSVVHQWNCGQSLWSREESEAAETQARQILCCRSVWK